MKARLKKIAVCALCAALILSAFALVGCGEKEEDKPSFTVTFAQGGATKSEITVVSGEKIDSAAVAAPDKEQDGFVTEWNFDFDLPVTESRTVSTISYTEGLTFAKSLKGGEYVVTGYTGRSEDVFMPDFYREKPVASIRAEAFKGNETIVSVRFPASLVSIGEEAFKACVNLGSVNFPDAVTTLGASAFSECEGLEEFTFPKNITIVSSRVVQGCNFDFVAVPEGVTAIEPYAFACKATTIVLPASLRRIEELGLWANLTTIYYAGEDYRWETVTISEVPYTNGGITFSAKSVATERATVYFYSETAPSKPGNYWHYVSGEPVVWA